MVFLGAGKSTLLMALLRMGNVNGSILIDGIDTVSIDLKTLRSNITVIPVSIENGCREQVNLIIN